jgi:hypothetical protein
MFSNHEEIKTESMLITIYFMRKSSQKIHLDVFWKDSKRYCLPIRKGTVQLGTEVGRLLLFCTLFFVFGQYCVLNSGPHSHFLGSCSTT